jgi:hypothetical protein
MTINSLPAGKQQSVARSFRHVSSQRAGFILLGLILCGIALLLIGLGLGEQSGGGMDFFLFPWMVLVGVTALIPTVYLYYKRGLVFYHPLVYGAVLGIIPGFVIGPIAITVGMGDTYAYSLIPDPKFYLPLALVYVALGFAGLTLGFALPVGRRVGRSLFAKLPGWDWSFKEVRIPALLLMAIGEVGTFSALQSGSSGYQMAQNVSVWGQTLVSLSSVGTFAQLVLWFTIFRARRLTPTHWLFIVLLTGVGTINALLGGNKGGLLWLAVFVFVVYFLAGRQLPLRRLILAGLIVGPLVLVGVSYGNAFRNLKGSEQGVGVTDYLSLVSDATSAVLTSDWGGLVSNGAESLFRRTEITTHLGVIVSNYERLAPLEKQYGLANDIATDLLTAFIPRFVWPDKPLISDARSLSALYFNVPNNSYATTPFSDLLRNFGPVGIPVGMAILGIVLSILYQLVAKQPTTAWRAGLYYALLTTVSYEGFYGSIFPGMIRAGVAAVGGVLFLRFLIGRSRRSFARA